MTDHSVEIMYLRHKGAQFAALELMAPLFSPKDKELCKLAWLASETAADLLELHDSTGISLDNWVHARALVEHLTGRIIRENHS